jgi:hypothetical protein
MAKRIKKTGQSCPFCGAGTTAVFEVPTRQKPGAFWYERHDAVRDAEWSSNRSAVCSRSGKALSITAWPTWALTANEKAIAKLRG